MRKLSRFVTAAGITGIATFGLMANAADAGSVRSVDPNAPTTAPVDGSGAGLPSAGAGMLLPIAGAGVAALVIGAAVNKGAKSRKA